MSYYIGIDIGTSSVKAMLINEMKSKIQYLRIIRFTFQTAIMQSRIPRIGTGRACLQ